MNSRKATHGDRSSRARSSIALSSAVLSPCLAAASSALAGHSGIADLPTSWAALANDSAMRPSENQKPDFSSDIEARKSYVIPALEILGFEVLLNQIVSMSATALHSGTCSTAAMLFIPMSATARRPGERLASSTPSSGTSGSGRSIGADQLSRVVTRMDAPRTLSSGTTGHGMKQVPRRRSQR
jgi:hypothetical protein